MVVAIQGLRDVGRRDDRHSQEHHDAAAWRLGPQTHRGGHQVQTVRHVRGDVRRRREGIRRRQEDPVENTRELLRQPLPIRGRDATVVLRRPRRVRRQDQGGATSTRRPDLVCEVMTTQMTE